MVKSLGAKSFAIALFMVSLLIVSNTSRTEGQADKSTQLPPGDWSFSAHPYLGPGYDSRPIVVFSVVTNVKNGLTVTKVALHNLSSKPVSAVKLNWYLSTEADPGSILLSGQTPLVALSGGLPVDGRRVLEFPVVSFAKICKSLMKGESLTGDFRMEVEVGEILYEDGSSQTARVTSNLYVPAKNNSVVPLTNRVNKVAQIGCAHQRCKFVPLPASHYECEGTSTPELCTNSGEFCCNTLCGNRPCGQGG